MHLSHLQGCSEKHDAHPDATDKSYRTGNHLPHFLAQGVTDDLRQIMSAKITGIKLNLQRPKRPVTEEARIIPIRSMAALG